eukprot:CAMPEP_0195507110 /NCGR_PEP_ID=MMETSP0794_2-20130614/619_1 /TAXON_ID=515487 /ORGANISM="Stephanopyxis turris, Strain CCMP 815" /LENGTH=346 /DNA_ID=CAMNT_0040633673 /DNA_START=208 /DNA_END=1248 /DNA_ORIENTATION=-
MTDDEHVNDVTEMISRMIRHKKFQNALILLLVLVISRLMVIRSQKQSLLEQIAGQQLRTHIVSGDWSRVVSRTKTHPHEARFRNRRGDTVLHLACHFDPPPIVIKSLLNAFPEAAILLNDYGCSPLHLACRAIASDEVIRQLLEVDMTAVLVKNQSNDTPLELLCWPRIQSNVIETALHWNTSELSLSSTLDANKDILAMFTRIWKSACLLQKAAYHNSIRDDPLPNGKVFRMVHACAAIKDCPLKMLRLAMKIHPTQLMESDEDDNLPLHLAIIRGGRKKWDNGSIDCILHAYPGAMTKQDKKSRLFPFMLAAVGDRASLNTVFRILRDCPELERFVGFSKNEMR